MEIKITLTKNLKSKPDENNLGFGKYFTDHIFVMDYNQEKGWHNPIIAPLEDVKLSPAIMALHYGQGAFEGLKCFKKDNGELILFRPEENFKRLNKSCDRLCMPQIDEDFALKSLMELIKIEKDWIPTAPNTSLYIRPFIFGSEEILGVRPSNEYKYIVMLSPVGSYYGSLAPSKILIEDYYVRAVAGGTGNVKAIANYAMSLKAQQKAIEFGCDQVLWLDATERKYIEEVGTSNAFFKINGEIITAPLDGTILPGITRDSSIKILRSLGYTVKEEKLSVDELISYSKSGKLEESFATGTAAKVSPIGEFVYKGESIIINDKKTGPVSQKLFDILTEIQSGLYDDKLNFITPVK